MSQRYGALIFSVLLLLGLGAYATESHAAGTWKASTGATVSIPSVPGDFTIIYTHPASYTEGHPERHKIDHFSAHWVKSNVSFSFVDHNNKTLTATFGDGDKTLTLTDESGKVVGTWTKVSNKT